MGCLLAALGAAPAASAACPFEDARPTAANLAEVRAAVVCLHNRERRASGMPPLRENPLLEASADAHSADMVARRYFGHDSLDGFDPFERMRRARYIHRGVIWNAGENIAWGSGELATARSIFEAWMARSGQRFTLLAREFSELGVGLALGAPSTEHGRVTSGVTYTVNFGWRQTRKRCVRRAAKRQRRSVSAACRGRTATP